MVTVITCTISDTPSGRYFSPIQLCLYICHNHFIKGRWQKQSEAEGREVLIGIYLPLLRTNYERIAPYLRNCLSDGRQFNLRISQLLCNNNKKPLPATVCLSISCARQLPLLGAPQVTASTWRCSSDTQRSICLPVIGNTNKNILKRCYRHS